MFGFNYAPSGWAECKGQLIPVSQNSALFALLGTHYGGNGRTTFRLPDLQGRVPMSKGNGTGRSPRSMGQDGGTESVTLDRTQIPPHTHGGTIEPNAFSETANESDPTDNVPAVQGKGRGGKEQYNSNSDTSMQGTNFTTDPTGEGRSHANMPPFQVVNFCISLQGIFPPRH